MKNIIKFTTVALLSSLTTLYLFVFFFSTPQTEELVTYPAPKPIPVTYNLNGLDSSPSNFVEAAEKSINAVVHVKNISVADDNMSYLDFFYGRRSSANRVGTGSGVIISPDGYIITNNHVIENATKIEVTTNDNVRYKARLIGTDAYTDIAVLKIESEDKLPYLFFGNSDNTRVGEWVLAVGNPFNLNSTVTAGIISAKSRDLNLRDRKNQSFIQTDAAVNMGNSGGALVNTQGELVGINTAISTFSGGFEGYSFAVPSNIARKVLEDLIEFGTTQKGILGVQGVAISPEVNQEMKLKQNEGFYVSEVVEGMGAAEAGIQNGDIILEVDQVKIKAFSDLTGYLESKRPGDIVKLSYVREDKTYTVDVELKKSNFTELLRMTLRAMTSKEKTDFGIKEGIVIENTGPYFQNQIEAGSLLIEINGNRIKTIDDLNQIDPSNIDWITYINPNGEKIRLRF